MEKIEEKTTGPCIVLAGAGTGKTFSIVEKINYLINNKIYAPEKIVCITFSKEAASNLISRVQKSITSAQEPIIKTFHAFSADLLRKYGSKINIEEKFKILDQDEAKVVLHKYFKVSPNLCHSYINSIGIAKDIGISIEQIKSYIQSISEEFNGENIEKKLEELQFALQTRYLKKENERKNLFEEINKLKKIASLNKFVNAWSAYEKLKVKKNYQDYSDLNKNALALLQKFPGIANYFDYIIVDEFQDINKVQLDFLIALAPHQNITVVGDLNQSIYRFRGAYKDNFLNFKKHFKVKESDIYNLDSSFRSPNIILQTAHLLIENNYKNKKDCFLVKNAHDRRGEPIEVYELKNGNEEARKVAEIVQKELEKGTSPEEICVMYRTHNQGRIIKNVLELKKIAYSSVSKNSLLKQKQIKAIIGYLTVIDKISKKERGGESAWWDLLYQTDFSNPDLIKIGKFIKEQRNNEAIISEVLLNELEEIDLSEEGILKVMSLIEKINLLIPLASKTAPEFILELFSIIGFVKEEEYEKEKDYFLSLNKFYELAKAHAEIHSPDLSSFVYYLSIIESLGIEIEAPDTKEKGVQLMTLHSTKGLEYKTVIITNFCQKRFPLEHSNISPLLPLELFPEFSTDENLHLKDSEELIKEYEQENQLFEERRLCYVAFTRTKEKLIITYAQDYGNKKYFPSQFLTEISYKNSPYINFIKDEQELYEKQDKKYDEIILLDNFQASLEAKREKNLVVPVLSPSALLLFIECQKRYEFKYIYNMPEKKTISWEALRFGSFMHEILENGVKSNFKTAKDFEDLAKEMHLRDEWESVKLEEALLLIKVFFERNKNKYNEKSKTEQMLPLFLGGLKFIGFADRIDFIDDGLEIIDYKTGASFIPPRQRNWQLGYYALAAQRLGKVKKITLDMLKQEKPLEFIIDENGNARSLYSYKMDFNIHEVEKEILQAARELVKCYKDGFTPCPAEKNCDFCREYAYFSYKEF